jgi:hypothetical protein
MEKTNYSIVKGWTENYGMVEWWNVEMVRIEK